MKRLRKTDIESMERELQVLKNPKMILGGTGETGSITGNITGNAGDDSPVFNGFCFFNCLEYLSELYGCGNNEGYYLLEYIKRYGADEAIRGVNPDHATEFLTAMFNTPTNNSDFTDTTTYMGVFNSGPNAGHAVILTDYDPNTDTYYYYDPTNPSNPGSATGSNFLGYWGINGC